MVNEGKRKEKEYKKEYKKEDNIDKILSSVRNIYLLSMFSLFGVGIMQFYKMHKQDLYDKNSDTYGIL